MAATTQAHVGATAISRGTGSAAAQPAMSSRRRPTRAASTPAARFVKAFANPKATMNESTAALDARPKSSRPMSGSVERSRPTIAPTNALIATSSENCATFSRSPRLDGRAAHATSASGRPARLAATIAACCAGAGGMSCEQRGDERVLGVGVCSARLWRRSKPIVETGFADRPRPQTEPE